MGRLGRIRDASARAALERKQEEIDLLKHDIRCLQCDVEAKDIEIQNLSAVIVRDRARVASETAEFTGREALLTSGPQTRPTL